MQKEMIEVLIKAKEKHGWTNKDIALQLNIPIQRVAAYQAHITMKKKRIKK